MLDTTLKNFFHIHLSETDSTNRFAMDLASKTTPKHGLCVFTDFQTAGKGQFGSTWDSERGLNILSSFIFQNPVIPKIGLFGIHLWICNSLMDALHATAGLPYCIKWPNDIFVNDKKLAGILIENHFKGNEIQYCIAGIGINVHQVVFPEAYPACSLTSETGQQYSIEKILYTLQHFLLKNEYSLDENHVQNALDEYNAVLYRKNQNSMFESKQGTRFEGIIRKVNANGELVLEVQNKLICFAHRDIRIVE